MDIFDNWSIRFSDLRQFNDTFDSDLRLHDKRPKGRRLKDLKTVGIFCMTEDPDSQLMWAHYAAQNTGFVLGLHTSVPPFSDDSGPLEVIYQPTPPSMPFSDEPPLDLFRIKPSAWVAEKEWRCIRRLALTDSRDFALSLDAIAEIIVGARIHKSHLTAILQMVEWVKPDFEIPVSESKPNRYTWEFEHALSPFRLCQACDGNGHVRQKETSA
ncbi:MAG: DUF2971 domain-containing protein [Bryobacteraceae bacterium]